MREGLEEQLDELVEMAGGERVTRLRAAPLSLDRAERLFEALVDGFASRPPGAIAPPRPSSRIPRPVQAAAPTPPPEDEATQAEVMIDADLLVVDATPLPPPASHPPALPPLPRPPTPLPGAGSSKDAFDAVLDEALAGDDSLSPMESVEAEIEVDFVDGLGDATRLDDFDLAVDDPLDAERDDDYDIDIDVDAFERMAEPEDGERRGFYAEDNVPTQAVRVDEVDIEPPPDSELNVRSSIKKLFRKK